MKRFTHSLFLLATFASTLSGDAWSTPKETQRYPFDPACAWGRISNGRGLILRCLTMEESERLSMVMAPAANNTQNVGASSQATGTTASAQTAASSTPQPPPTAAPETPPAPGAQAVGGAAAIGSPAAATADSYVAELVSVTADDGELPLAKKKLGLPLDRYVKCVADFGGIRTASGQVEVRFLVRERGRAEGASVEKYQGMSEAAASCIAQVVDRRPTGVPEAPVVGATATIRVRKKPVK